MSTEEYDYEFHPTKVKELMTIVGAWADENLDAGFTEFKGALAFRDRRLVGIRPLSVDGDLMSDITPLPEDHEHDAEGMCIATDNGPWHAVVDHMAEKEANNMMTFVYSPTASLPDGPTPELIHYAEVMQRMSERDGKFVFRGLLVLTPNAGALIDVVNDRPSDAQLIAMGESAIKKATDIGLDPVVIKTMEDAMVALRAGTNPDLTALLGALGVLNKTKADLEAGRISFGADGKLTGGKPHPLSLPPLTLPKGEYLN